MNIPNDIIIEGLIILFFVIGMGIGIMFAFAERCSYCGNTIMIKKVRVRIPIEYGYFFMPYHRECYMKYVNSKENQIVS